MTKLKFGMRRLAKGFSLPEIAIAVAVAALGITSVLGLLPSGLNNLREAGDVVSMSRIFQQMIGDVQSSDWGEDASGNGNWSNLQTYHGSRRYFDGDGTEIRDTDTGFNMRLAYVALFDIGAGNVTLPSATPSASVRPDMKLLVIHVAVTTDPNYDFGRTTSLHVKRSFTVTRQF